MEAKADVEVPVRPGDEIGGKYVVGRTLGVGAMGVVVEARHRQLNQRFALKFLRRDALRSTDASTRFLREARAASHLTSPNVVRVVDFGTLDDGAPFLAMEYLEGIDLESHLARVGALSISDVVGYALEICDALGEAHALGIVHRDLKPQNLFLATRPNGKATVKVLDFGISKITAAAITGGSVALTQTRTIMGTPSYMAPEQWSATKHVDARADIWSLGACLYRFLTGRLPYEADSPLKLAAMLAMSAPPAIEGLRPDTPPALAAIVRRCLAPRPEDRFGAVSELVAALEAMRDGNAALPSTPPDRVVVSTPRSHDASFVVAAAQTAMASELSARTSRRPPRLVLAGASVLVVAVAAVAAPRLLRRAPAEAPAAAAARSADENASAPVSAPALSLASSAPAPAPAASSATQDALGVPSATQDALGVPSATQDALGVPSATQDALGVPSATPPLAPPRVRHHAASRTPATANPFPDER